MDKAAENSKGRWAPLQNLALASRAVQRALDRAPHLPGIVVFHAPYGTGKSHAQGYCMNEFDGCYVQLQSYFTRKSFVQAVLKEMSIKPGRTVSDMMEQAADQLERSNRPLLLDDVHRVTQSSVLGLVLDLHNKARTTIVLAGNEDFPKALHDADPQLSSRVLVWQALQPTSAEDARKLCSFYCRDKEGRPIDVDDDILKFLRTQTKNNTRLICINIEHLRDFCQKHNLRKIDLETWGQTHVFTGDTPKPRPQ